MTAPKWFKSTSRVITTPAGRYAAILHHVRYNKKTNDQEGRWYYTPAFPTKELARTRARDALKDLQNGFAAHGAAFPFDGDVAHIDLDKLVWKPLL